MPPRRPCASRPASVATSQAAASSSGPVGQDNRLAAPSASMLADAPAAGVAPRFNARLRRAERQADQREVRQGSAEVVARAKVRPGQRQAGQEPESGRQTADLARDTSAQRTLRRPGAGREMHYEASSPTSEKSRGRSRAAST